MKKRITLILMITCALGMVGCSETAGKENSNKMYIEPAQLTEEENLNKMYIEPAKLTEEEENITELLGANANQNIFDFVIDDTIQSIQVNTYRLEDGEWELESGGGGEAFSDTEGRVALEFDKIAEGIRIAIQSEHVGSSTAYEREPEEGLKEIGGYATSFLSDKTEIIYEEEIALAVQVITDKNEVVSYHVDYFKHPEEYEKLGYEGVFAVTIRFSQEGVK